MKYEGILPHLKWFFLKKTAEDILSAELLNPNSSYLNITSYHKRLDVGCPDFGEFFNCWIIFVALFLEKIKLVAQTTNYSIVLFVDLINMEISGW